jgi:hypothetical protein
LIKGIEFKELLFLLVIVIRTDEDDNEYGKKDGKTLNPSYIVI